MRAFRATVKEESPGGDLHVVQDNAGSPRWEGDAIVVHVDDAFMLEGSFQYGDATRLDEIADSLDKRDNDTGRVGPRQAQQDLRRIADAIRNRIRRSKETAFVTGYEVEESRRKLVKRDRQEVEFTVQVKPKAADGVAKAPPSRKPARRKRLARAVGLARRAAGGRGKKKRDYSFSFFARRMRRRA